VDASFPGEEFTLTAEQDQIAQPVAVAGGVRDDLADDRTVGRGQHEHRVFAVVRVAYTRESNANILPVRPFSMR
jgi:hypothetical protein